MSSLPFETFLRVRAANGGVFSPDGRCLVFLLNTPGVAQVYRADSPECEPRRVTRSQETVRGVHWSPDGTRLLFAEDRGGNERTQLHLCDPDGKESRPLTHSPDAIHSFGGWSRDARRIIFGANRRDPRYFDLYVLDVESGDECCVLERDATLIPIAWSSDGMVLVREDRRAFDHRLHLLDVETGGFRLLTPDETPIRYLTPGFAGSSNHVVACTDRDRDFLALCLLDTGTGTWNTLLSPEWDVEACDAAADGKRIAALINRAGYSTVVVGRLAGTEFSETARVELHGVASEPRFGPAGRSLAITITGPTENPNVWQVDPDTGERCRWTDAPMEGLSADKLAAPELVRYPTHDQRLIPAWLYRSHEARNGAPVIVHVHGGPESQDRPGFSPVYQYLVHRGYTVLAPNVRGSLGYGRAYTHLDDVEKRYDALRDVEYAHHWLTGQGIARADRIGIMGASYGGFTVLACLTRQPELWAVGVDIVGIANFETFFKHTGPWRRHMRAGEYGDPERDAELLRDLSPIHAVDRVRAPLMVIQGANDPRVPQVESDQMVAQLRARSHPVEYLLFEDEGHGIVKLPNRIRAYTAIAAFLDKHLGLG